MTSIFISYRRDDAGGHAGRLSDRLVARLGADRVFMDVSDIRPGENFEQAIQRTLAKCDHVLAVIGPRWLSSLTERQSTGEDFVRSEIAAALLRGATVIPVLVGGAGMPAKSTLPPDMAALARCQAVVIEDRSFDEDAARLVNFLAGTQPAIAPRPASPRSHRTPLLALTAAAVALMGLWWLWPSPATNSQPTPSPTAEPVAAEPNLDGEWVAELQKPGRRPFRIRMTLARSGAQVIGSVTYPTGDAAIVDGQYADGQLTFQTSHVPQFANEPATIRVQGRVEGDEIRITTADTDGVATGVARRATAPRRGSLLDAGPSTQPATSPQDGPVTRPRRQQRPPLDAPDQSP
ncbi:MAG: TIR domain-containing protein [Acidobacteria bacterium]|nr:TIR domain-containing protein [Acidobacteriota bacterium]